MDKTFRANIPQQDTDINIYTRRGAFVLAILVISLCAYFINTALQQPTSLINTLTIIMLSITGMTSAAGLALSILNRAEAGLRTILYALAFMGAGVSLLVSGRVISGSFSILIVSMAAIIWLLPASKRKSHTTLALAIFSFMWIVEWLNPPWRLSAQGSFLGPFAAIFFVILVAILAFLYWRSVIVSSLRLQIMVWVGVIISTLALLLLAYSVLESRQSAIEAAEREALAVSEANAAIVQERLSISLVTARSMATTLESIKDPSQSLRLSRAQVNDMLKNLAEENPEFLATYTLWEPNAFDGFDALYVNAEGHDETGRFIPYWVRRPDGSVTVEPLIDYEVPGNGDWYQIPRQTLQEYSIAPLIYPVAGVDTLMATFTIPIVVDGKFYGITGVDSPITFVQTLVDDVNLYDNQAEAILLSDTGILIAVHKRPELTNQPASELYPDFAELQPRIAAGETFVSLSPDGQNLRVFSAIKIGEVGTKWAFSLIIPFSVITSQVTDAAILEAVIGLLLIVIALFILWYLTGLIVQPILNLTAAAEAVSRGDLNINVNVATKNETGTLASAFNLMTTQLRDTISTLETRIADRTRNLELAAEVGRAVSQVRELSAMLKDACDLILKQFDLYYVQVYLVTASGSTLKLAAGTGTVGSQLLGRGHSLPLDINSINGRAAFDKHTVLITDTRKSAVFRQNPLLPDTRSELAVPLIVGDKVVGVLDMQANKPSILIREVLPAFEALAGQMAIAIQNANLLTEAEEARAQVEAQARRLVREGWNEHLDAIHKPEKLGFVYEQDQVSEWKDTEKTELPAHVQAIGAPISITGEMLGSLVVEIEDESRREQISELVYTVARQVSQQIENLRLLESAERYRAESERAARLQTIEGWQDFMASRNAQSLGFLYDTEKVHPLNGNNDEERFKVTLPLTTRQETIGKLMVDGLSPDDQEEISLANNIVERLSTHIETLRLIEETKRGQMELDKRAQQLAAVAEISTISSQELDVQKLLESVVHLTQRKFGLYHAHVFLYNEKTEELAIAACGWKEGDINEGTHGTAVISISQQQSLVARAARTRQAVIVNDVHNEPGWLPNPLLPDTASELAVPLLIGDQILGVLDIQSERLNAFTEEDANIQTTLASQVATAIQNARSFNRAQQQAQRESTLNVISQKIQSATTVEAVLQIAARELGHALGAPMTIAKLNKSKS